MLRRDTGHVFRRQSTRWLNRARAIPCFRDPPPVGGKPPVANRQRPWDHRFWHCRIPSVSQASRFASIVAFVGRPIAASPIYRDAPHRSEQPEPSDHDMKCGKSRSSRCFGSSLRAILRAIPKFHSVRSARDLAAFPEVARSQRQVRERDREVFG